MTINTDIESVSISKDFNALRKKYQISLTEALRVGLSILLSERGCRPNGREFIVNRMKGYLEKEINALNSELKFIKKLK